VPRNLLARQHSSSSLSVNDQCYRSAFYDIGLPKFSIDTHKGCYTVKQSIFYNLPRSTFYKKDVGNSASFLQRVYSARQSPS